MTSIQQQFAMNGCVLMIALILGVAIPVQGQEDLSQPVSVQVTPKEQKVKAAYIYNFSRYFEWPETSFEGEADPFVIGVLGNDPLGNQLDRLALKKSVRNRKIVVLRFAEVKDYEECQMLFVTRSVSDEQFQMALEQANTDHVLVVSEKPPETRKGSSVQIFIDQTGKVGFEIDVGVVSARSLHVSAKLLKLASVSDSSSR